MPEREQATLKDLWQENPPDRADPKVEASFIDAERDQNEPQKPKLQRYRRETKPETGEQGELTHKGFTREKTKPAKLEWRPNEGLGREKKHTERGGEGEGKGRGGSCM